MNASFIWYTNFGKSFITIYIFDRATDGRQTDGFLVANAACLGTRIRLLKCYVWSTLLYGCETWTVSKTMEARLQAAEM